MLGALDAARAADADRCAVLAAQDDAAALAEARAAAATAAAEVAAAPAAARAEAHLRAAAVDRQLDDLAARLASFRLAGGRDRDPDPALGGGDGAELAAVRAQRAAFDLRAGAAARNRAARREAAARRAAHRLSPADADAARALLRRPPAAAAARDGDAEQDAAVVARVGNVELRLAELRCLAPRQWLNDEVINATAELLRQRLARYPEHCLRAHFFNTFFYALLDRGGYPRVRSWTRTVDLFACARIFVPVHLGAHWCLAVANLPQRRIEYLDSLGGRNPACLAKLAAYLRDEHAERRGSNLDTSDWALVHVPTPRQDNSDDCGMFCCMLMILLSEAGGSPDLVDAAWMPFFRSQLLLDIVRGSIPLHLCDTVHLDADP